MTEEVVFYHNPRSRAQMVHWMLEEVGAPYRVVLLDFEKGEHKRPEFLAINPMGKLPTIVHRGQVVTESGAIIAYLADAFPAAGLAPAVDSPLRGPWYRWLFFAAGCIDPALVETMMKRPAPDNRMAVGWGSYENVVSTLAGALKHGGWLVGDRFTAADLYVGGQLGWAMMFDAPGIKGEKLFEDYVARVNARPALQRLQAG